MTVGELVERRIALKARRGGTGGVRDSEHVIYRILVMLPQALRSLGIWDAEVLEGELECRNWRRDGHAHDVAIFTTEPAPAVLCEMAEADQPVRLIVLPLQGDEPLRPWPSSEKEQPLTECISEKEE